MQREALFAKIHHGVVTECQPDYTGSIVIDQDLLDATGMLGNEKVLIGDCENGNRFETYIIPGDRGSGIIGINGAAARLTAVNHRVIILSFCQLSLEEMANHRPKVVVCNHSNGVEQLIEYSPPIIR